MASKGKVKWFNETKGYGFIECEGGGNDVFVHISAVKAARMETLQDGDVVQFDIEEGRKGKSQAANLRLIAVGS